MFHFFLFFCCIKAYSHQEFLKATLNKRPICEIFSSIEQFEKKFALKQ